MSIFNFIRNPWKWPIVAQKYHLGRFVPDDVYIKSLFYLKFGYRIDFNNPKTFNEKMQWLKLHHKNEIYTTMVDKYAVKTYVAAIIGDAYIIPTLGVWDKFNDIDLSTLPEQFVLKCTHDSGGLVICKNKSEFDKKSARKKIESCLKKNYYYMGREWPYKNVKPRIIAERYIENSSSSDNKGIQDYKIHCFNGIPKFILVCGNRFSETGLEEDFFDIEWNHMPIKRPDHPNSMIPIEKPSRLQEMLKLAKILSKDIPFIRVDFYEVDKKVYFGELTLYPASGLEKFEPEKYDEIFGSWIDLH